jgi:hypothetical protein
MLRGTLTGIVLFSVVPAAARDSRRGPHRAHLAELETMVQSSLRREENRAEQPEDGNVAPHSAKEGMQTRRPHEGSGTTSDQLEEQKTSIRELAVCANGLRSWSTDWQERISAIAYVAQTSGAMVTQLQDLGLPMHSSFLVRPRGARRTSRILVLYHSRDLALPHSFCVQRNFNLLCAVLFRIAWWGGTVTHPPCKNLHQALQIQPTHTRTVSLPALMLLTVLGLGCAQILSSPYYTMYKTATANLANYVQDLRLNFYAEVRPTL